MKAVAVKDLINLWPSRASLSGEINRLITDPGKLVSTDRVHKWAQNGTIPPYYHAVIIEAGQARDLDVDANLLVHVHYPDVTRLPARTDVTEHDDLDKGPAA